jgi:hypothetical protein
MAQAEAEANQQQFGVSRGSGHQRQQFINQRAEQIARDMYGHSNMQGFADKNMPVTAPPSPQPPGMAGPSGPPTPPLNQRLAAGFGQFPAVQKILQDQMEHGQDVDLAGLRHPAKQPGETSIDRQMAGLARDILGGKKRNATPEEKAWASDYLRGAKGVLSGGGQAGGGGVGEVAGADPAIVAALQRAKKPVTPYNIQMAQTDPEVRAALGL